MDQNSNASPPDSGSSPSSSPDESRITFPDSGPLSDSEQNLLKTLAHRLVALDVESEEAYLQAVGKPNAKVLEELRNRLKRPS